jgi:hypothetical protein
MLLVRRLVALAAAYAVALNVLLQGLALAQVPAAVGDATSSVICAAGANPPDSGAGLPVRPRPLCPWSSACAASGCGSSVADGDRPLGALTFSHAARLAVSELPFELQPRASHIVGTHAARAPPRA